MQVDHDPPCKNKKYDDDEEDQSQFAHEEGYNVQCPMQRWAFGRGQVWYWKAELPVPLPWWAANDPLVPQRYPPKKIQERIQIFLGDLIKQELHIGALPSVEKHGTSSTCSGFKALSVDQLKNLANGEESSEAPKVAAAALPAIRITKCWAADAADDSPTASPSPSRSSSASSVSVDTNSASFVEGELRQTHDLMMALVDAELGLEMILKGERRSGLALLKVAARAGSAEASHNLGVAYQQVGDLERAVASYRRAAAQNYVPSLLNLAVFYRRGLGGVERDEAMAGKLSERAKRLREAEGEADQSRHCKSCAENGWVESAPREVIANDPDSLYLLARAYHLGLSGCPVDLAYAEALYKTAADAGHASARNALRRFESESDKDVVDVEEGEDAADVISPLATSSPSTRTCLRTFSLDSGYEVATSAITT